MTTFTVEHTFHCDECGEEAKLAHKYYEGQPLLKVALPEGWSRVNDLTFCWRHQIVLRTETVTAEEKVVPIR